MEKQKQKSKKDKSMKYAEKDKANSFITDVKTLKENLKIREILRTVKMNSSMRMKAPRGSKVMHNRDFSENEDFFDETANNEDLEPFEIPSAMNPDVIINNSCINANELVLSNESWNSSPEIIDTTELKSDVETISESGSLHKLNCQSETHLDCIRGDLEIIPGTSVLAEVNLSQTQIDNSHVKTRDRKLSLDHTMLTRREGLSQSELDLHSIGKLPLERKSSFFRKKMDSFLKNTTEIFKRQSFQSKTQCPLRRESMSVSLQSLYEKTSCNGQESCTPYQEELQGSMRSLQSSLTADCSTSSQSVNQSDRLPPDSPSESSLTGSQPTLATSQLLLDVPSISVHSLNEAYVQEALLNRAISMNSGLDSAHGKGRRKTSRSNRVTWLASEGLTNYFRRVIQDETSRNMQICHSYQDFSTIPENNLYGVKTDSKGRRLSYQRAVSGEDPVTSTKYQDSSLRRKPPILEISELTRLQAKLADFSANGIPPLEGFTITKIDEEAFICLFSIDKWMEPDEVYGELRPLKGNEEARQAVLRELVSTEVDYIHHLIYIVEVFIASAHALQEDDLLLMLDTRHLFLNAPDILNANIRFWDICFYPMLKNSVQNKTPLNSTLMAKGFYRFREVFQPYEKYLNEQSKALDYLRFLSSNNEFSAYLLWCHQYKSRNRLQLVDIIVKPMQRLTKYSLLLRRLIEYTDMEPERSDLITMDRYSKGYVNEVNRSIRLRQELEKLDELSKIIENYEVNYRDEELDRAFKLYSMFDLKSPMINCNPNHSRTVIHEGDLRFKDRTKEIEVKAFLLTDMLLICKKVTKLGQHGQQRYKMIRAKYMINKISQIPRSRSSGDSSTIVFAVLDDTDTSHSAFALTDSSKDSHIAIKTWEQKILEAKKTYDLCVKYANSPEKFLSDLDADASTLHGPDSSNTASKLGEKQTPEEVNATRDARERTAVTMHRRKNISVECDNSLQSEQTDSLEGDHGSRVTLSTAQTTRRTSTGRSSRMSRFSSFQQSTSISSQEEPQPGTSGVCRYVPGPSAEHKTLPPNADNVVASITVNIECESEPETDECQEPISLIVSPVPPLSLIEATPPKQSPPRSASACRDTLRVQPEGHSTLVHSLPDLTLEPLPKMTLTPMSMSASDKLYQSHQELLQKKRLAAGQQLQFLYPDNRSAGHSPSSPNKLLLKRGLAFSYSRHPPLVRMGHVDSHIGCPESGTSDTKGDKKGKQISSRSRGNGSSPKPSRKNKNLKGRMRRDSSESSE